MITASIDAEISRLQRTLRATEQNLSELDPHHEPLLANALLILAVQRMIERDGISETATVLCRLADAVRVGPAPPPSRAVDLSTRHS
jgi:hypothetical protein